MAGVAPETAAQFWTEFDKEVDAIKLLIAAVPDDPADLTQYIPQLRSKSTELQACS
jgi:hypothetical protein